MNWILIVIIATTPAKRDQIEGFTSLAKCQETARRITESTGEFVFVSRDGLVTAICKPQK